MKKFDQINVIPFIDIMLVLLAIVLTTASFVSQGLIKVNVPEAETAELINSDNKDAFEISINAQQKMHIQDAEVSQAELISRLEKLPKQTSIILRVDENVPFKKFVFVIDLLKKYELKQVSILTRKAES